MTHSIIIPAAGLGKRMKSYGPKSLINIDTKNLIHKQIDVLTSVYPDSDIVVVGGFEYEKVFKYLTQLANEKIKFVANTKYSTTNVSRSIELGYRECNNKNVLIVYGDLIFNKDTFSNLNLDTSGLLVDCNHNMDYLEVGINEEQDIVKSMAYSYKNKWSHIAFLEKQEIENFNNIVNQPYNDRMFAFEVFNIMISEGSQLKTYHNEKMFIAEIDDSDDIEKARKLASEGKF